MILNNTGSTLMSKILQLSIIKKCAILCKNIIHEIRFQINLQDMDFQWQYFGSRCWLPFPPSYYHIHTKEELQRFLTELKEEIEKNYNPSGSN